MACKSLGASSAGLVLNTICIALLITLIFEKDWFGPGIPKDATNHAINKETIMKFEREIDESFKNKMSRDQSGNPQEIYLAVSAWPLFLSILASTILFIGFITQVIVYRKCLQAPEI
ncbi:hypothetical protein RF11_03980 [Thelohanellus kitauei]|uniref:Uncharacterized protein n=1 Tax=Thelohanellus kitauei TaxID=669202 RepID=A0A0C2M8F9_THEKT|nr:hypothetical protein RF11_03980 [Thelohanellus kitauei]